MGSQEYICMIAPVPENISAKAASFPLPVYQTVTVEDDLDVAGSGTGV